MFYGDKTMFSTILSKIFSKKSEKPLKKHVIGHHIGPNKDYEFYYQGSELNGELSGEFVTATSDGKILSKVVIKEVVERAHEKYMKNVDEENAGMRRYRVHRKTADELLEEYEILSAKVDEISHTIHTVNIEQFALLVIDINKNLLACTHMIVDHNPNPQAIYNFFDNMIQVDVNSLWGLYDKIKNALLFPITQDFEDKLNAYETALKKMSAPTTPCEASLLEDCIDWVNQFKRNMVETKGLIDVDNRLYLKLAPLIENTKKKLDAVTNAIATRFPRNNNQHSNTNLYSSNQTYTPGCYQPAPSQDTGAIDLLTKQTATMNI